MRLKLQEARALKKLLSQEKLIDAYKTIKWIIEKENAEKEYSALLNLKKEEVVENLRFFTKVANKFTKNKNLRKWLKEIRKELRKKSKIDFDYLMQLIAKLYLSQDISSELDNWVRKNRVKIEKLIRKELNIDNVIVGLKSGYIHREIVDENFLEGLTITDPLGEDREYINHLLSIVNEKGDAIILNPLGIRETFRIGPELHYIYTPLEKILKHESGHRWVRKMSKELMQKVFYCQNVYHRILDEAVAYMWEGALEPYELNLKDGQEDVSHTLGYEIAKNTERLGITPKKLVEGRKIPKAQ